MANQRIYLKHKLIPDDPGVCLAGHLMTAFYTRDPGIPSEELNEFFERVMDAALNVKETFKEMDNGFFVEPEHPEGLVG